MSFIVSFKMIMLDMLGEYTNHIIWWLGRNERKVKVKKKNSWRKKRAQEREKRERKTWGMDDEVTGMNVTAS